MNNVDVAAATTSISNKLALYNRSGDNGTLDVKALFDRSSILEIPGQTIEGIDAIAAFVEGRRKIALAELSAGTRARHFLGSILVTVVDSVSARAESYFLVIREGQIENFGSYRDSFRCVDGDWLIAHRKVELHWPRPAEPPARV